MKTWEDMTEIERVKASYSDLHKEVYGFRPRNYSEQAEWSDDQWLDEYDRLYSRLSECETD